MQMPRLNHTHAFIDGTALHPLDHTSDPYLAPKSLAELVLTSAKRLDNVRM